MTTQKTRSMDHLEVPLPEAEDEEFEDVPAGAAATAAPANSYLALMKQLVEQQQQQFALQQQLMAMQAGGRGQDPAATVAAAAGNKVKLPPFWEKDAAAWFGLVDKILEESNIVDARARYRAALLHIPQHLLERARGVINAAAATVDPYGELKARLIELLTPSKLDLINSILWGAELGGRRPSEMMDSMLAALPPGEAAGLIFKGLFLHRLPADMRELVALQFTVLTAKELAMYADTIWDARNAKKTTVAAIGAASAAKPEIAEESALEKAVAALALQRQPRKGGNRNRKRQAGRGGGNGGQGGGHNNGQSGHGGKYVCYKHLKFGDQAWSCGEPLACQFSEN